MESLYSEENIDQIAKSILSKLAPKDMAVILALKGDLGAGKTTLTKAIAHELGVSDVVTSPTFVIAKFYDTGHQSFKKLIHIDAYRIEDIRELLVLDWENIISNKDHLVVVEWPEKIQELIDQEETNNFFIENTGENLRKIYEK